MKAQNDHKNQHANFGNEALRYMFVPFGASSRPALLAVPSRPALPPCPPSAQLDPASPLSLLPPFHQQIVWPVSVFLSWYIASNPLLFRGKTVIELGAGCGLASLVAARVGAATTWMTDGSEVCVLPPSPTRANSDPLVRNT